MASLCLERATVAERRFSLQDPFREAEAISRDLDETRAWPTPSVKKNRPKLSKGFEPQVVVERRSALIALDDRQLDVRRA